ncbi:MAG: hypothetical protein JF616_14290 [Fibrobacteres bacterium]|nr:hypothetical protein [Fibrobacterota bacterium]
MGKNKFTFRSFPRLVPAAAAFILAGFLCSKCTQPEEENVCPSDSTEILLTYPKGGESFKIGDTLRVKWKLCNYGPSEITAVDPLFSPDSGKTWCFLQQNSIPVGSASFGNYAWKIPDSIGLQGVFFQLKNNPKCRFRVEQYTPVSEKQRSTSGIFTIK